MRGDAPLLMWGVVSCHPRPTDFGLSGALAAMA